MILDMKMYESLGHLSIICQIMRMTTHVCNELSIANGGR